MTLRCPGCGFDGGRWTPTDARNTARILDRWFALLAEGAPAEVTAALTPYAAAVADAARRGRTAESAEACLAAVHDGWHALQDAGRCRQRLGAGAPTATGRVVQVNASRGGVPKLPLPRAEVDAGGLVGDRQRERAHHGRPWQALCLWSAEVIAGMAAEGHPIGPGCAGENLTLAGLDWATIRPGVRLRVGTVLTETTPYAIPCRKNARWFRGGDIARMAHERHPGQSRIYARVLAGGVVAPGDPVVVEPRA